MTTTIAPSAGQNVGLLQAGPGAVGYGAIDWRRMVAASPLQEGVFSAGAYKVTAGGALNVSIAASTGGGALIQGDNIASQGLYYVAPHSAAITEAMTAAHATLPRIDQVILEVLDATHDGGGSNTARTRVVAGTATSGATLDNRTGAAALPNNAIRLADVLVPAAAASVLAANIRNRCPAARGASHLIERTTGTYSTASAALVAVDSTNLRSRIECSGVPIRVKLGCRLTDTAISSVTLSMYMDGVARDERITFVGGAGASVPFDWSEEFVPAAGSHTFEWYYSTNAGTVTLVSSATQRLQHVVLETVRDNFDNT